MAIISYNEVIYLISNAFRIFAIKLFLEFFFYNKNLRWQPWTQTAVLFLYFIINSGVYLFARNPVLTIVTNAVLFLVLTLPYRASIGRRLFATCSIFMIGVICEGIVARTAILLYGLCPKIEIITYVVSNFLLYFIILIMRRFFIEREEIFLPKLHWLCITIIPCISSIADITLILGGYEQWVNVTVISCLFIINIAFFYLYAQVVEKYEVEMQNQSLSHQNKAYNQQLLVIRTAEDNMKRLQHDFKNHLIALKELSSNCNTENFKEYFRSIEEKIDMKSEFVMTGNESLDGLINYKLQTLYDLGINVELNINIPQNINIHAFDEIVILGNLLDNAIRALQEQENGFFRMDFVYDRGTIYLHTKNSFIGEIKKKGNTFFSTKKDSNEPHGIGLSNVKRIVEKYSGVLTILTEENFFDVEIVMYV
ncbi:sensor histidine kinase [Anaerotignum sp.]|uniref:sensor histidine kinase n=1 Tax=Anaerotignum sp. TaxID=2039241 RepID=UPI0028A2078A|nr:GHKL domain-containing protein [Anaerotignum sp.]